MENVSWEEAVAALPECDVSAPPPGPEETAAGRKKVPAAEDAPLGVFACWRAGKGIWRDVRHRRRLRAASALLFVGIWGITYLLGQLFSFMGLSKELAAARGPFFSGAVMAGVGLVLSLLLLYPLWLGMLSYAAALHRGEDGAEKHLFSYYTEKRRRRYALRQGLFFALRLALFLSAILALGGIGRYFGGFYAAKGDAARAALLYGATWLVQLLLPILYFWHTPDFILTRRLFEEGKGVFAARGGSIRRMEKRKGRFFLLLVSFLPALLLSLLLLGIGIPLWLLPRFVLTATAFTGRPTS